MGLLVLEIGLRQVAEADHEVQLGGGGGGGACLLVLGKDESSISISVAGGARLATTHGDGTAGAGRFRYS